jgi:hypothetical protein
MEVKIHSFSTSDLYGDQWSASQSGRFLLLGKELPETVWAPERSGLCGEEKIPNASTGNQTPTTGVRIALIYWSS